MRPLTAEGALQGLLKTTYIQEKFDSWSPVWISAPTEEAKNAFWFLVVGDISSFKEMYKEHGLSVWPRISYVKKSQAQEMIDGGMALAHAFLTLRGRQQHVIMIGEVAFFMNG